MRRTVVIGVGVVGLVIIGMLVWAATAEVAPPAPERVETVLDEATLARP